MPVILVNNRGFPYVTLRLYFRAGPALDPPGKDGLTVLTTRMLVRGTAKRKRAAFEEEVESLGGEITPAVFRHGASLGGGVVTRHLERFVELLTEAISQPVFDPEELGKVKREMIANIEAERDDDGVTAGRWFRRLLYGQHPRGRISSGTTRTVASLTREDAIAHYERYFTRRNLLTVAAGDVTHEDLTAMLDGGLGALRTGEETKWSFEDLQPVQGRRLALIDKPERTQAHILMGHASLSVTDPDFLAIDVATTAFGRTFTSRLMEEVRVKRGWSYGAYANLSAEPIGSIYSLTASPSIEYADQTVALLVQEFEKFVNEGLTDEEIEFARRYLLNAFPFMVETPTLRAAQLAKARLLGHPDGFVDSLTARIKALDVEHVRDAVRRRLDPENLLIAVVCSAESLGDRLRALPGICAVSVHPHDEES